MNQPKLFSRSLVTVSVSLLFFVISFFLLVVIMSAYAMDKFKVTPAEAGLVTSLFVVGSLASRFIFSRWIEKAGQKKMLCYGLIASLIITSLYFVANNILFLYGVRFLHGAAFGVVTSASATIAANLIPKERRGEGLAYFNLSPTLGNAIGPFLGMFIYQHGNFNIVFMVSGAAALLSLMLGLFTMVPEIKLTSQQNEELKGFRLRNFLEPKAIPISLFLAVIIMSYASIVTFLTPYARQENLLESASFFFIVYSIVVFFTRPYVGRLYDRKGANLIIYPAIVVFAVGMLLVSQAYAGWTLLLAAALLGISCGSMNCLAQTIAVQSSPQHRLGLANSTYFVFYDIGVAVGPFLFGLLLPLASYRVMYAIFALVSLACMGLYYYLHGRKAAVLKKEISKA
jgi:MFS family permease